MMPPGGSAFTRWFRSALAPATAFLLGGLVGLAYLWWRRKKRPTSTRRHPALGRATIVAFTGLLLAGALFRTVIAVGGVRQCPSPAGATLSDTALDDPSPPVAIGLEKAVTWPTTGLGMAYAQARHGYRCLITHESFYFDEHHHGWFGRKSFTVGDVFLSRFRDKQSEDRRLALFDHERHHRRQWAIATVLAGPLAFPVAYTVDDIFFPQARNHFEREAGLARGGYDPQTQGGPKFKPIDVVILVTIAGGAELYAYRRRRRRARQASTG
jgi:hypothetical protein